jgi:hypothetical protein
LNPVFKALAGVKNYVGAGLFETMGAQILRKGADGSTTWGLLGRELQTTAGKSGFKFGGEYKSGAWEKALTIGFTGITGLSMAGGYMEGGVGGAIAAVSADIAVSSALAKHGYKYGKNVAGIREASSKWSMGGRMARYVVGSGIAAGASAAVGGGIPGFAAGLVGGSLGVRHGGLILAGYAGYQAAKFTGNTIGSVLKAGHQHRQMQKSIQTSGSMAAFNTQGAHTMRQRAVQSIHKSHLNARSALGSESQYFHYPSKNYHSRYRGAY